MIILKETNNEQELNIIARDSGINLLTFTDEQTRHLTTIVSADFIDAGYYLTADVVLDFLEQDHTYRLRAYKSETTDFLERVIEDGGIVDLDSNECFGFLNETNTELSFSSLVFVTNQDVIDNAGAYSVNEYTSREETQGESEYITYED